MCGEIRLTLAEVRRRTPSAVPAWGPRGTTPRLTVRGTTVGAPPPPPPPRPITAPTPHHYLHAPSLPPRPITAPTPHRYLHAPSLPSPPITTSTPHHNPHAPSLPPRPITTSTPHHYLHAPSLPPRPITTSAPHHDLHAPSQPTATASPHRILRGHGLDPRDAPQPRASTSLLPGAGPGWSGILECPCTTRHHVNLSQGTINGRPFHSYCLEGGALQRDNNGICSLATYRGGMQVCGRGGVRDALEWWRNGGG